MACLAWFVWSGMACGQVDFVAIHSFGYGTAAGANPIASLMLGTDGLLYGTTTNGGGARQGTIFRMATNGAAYTVLHTFQGAAADGAQPGATVIEGSDGLLYGTTEYGGVSGYGTAYRMNKDGSGYSVLYHFPTNAGVTAGYPRYPAGALLEGSDGLLYGTARAGGSGNQGAAYRLAKNGTGFTVLHSFTTTDGYAPRGALLEGLDGWLYGATSLGGSPAVSAYGTVFKMAKTGAGYAVLRSFSYAVGSEGVYVSPTIALSTDGYLYGTTRIGGTNFDGVVFRLRTNGLDFSALHHFGTGASDGTGPVAGPILAGDGRLYGVTADGGGVGAGAIFRVNTDGSSYQVVYSFSDSATSGAHPRARLIDSAAGVLYGTTIEGGAEGVGTAFRVQRDGGGHAVLNSFTVSGGDGAYPAGGLMEASDGLLYGTTQNGGANLAGTIYRMSPQGSNHAVLHSFSMTAGDGYLPMTSPVEGRDGVLYGTTWAGGSAGRGTVYKINRNGSGYTIVRSFLSTGGDGAFPRGLLEASDGYFYGTTQLGGSNNVGTVFRMARDGTSYSILRHFLTSGGDGRNPYASLIEGTDGLLYGTTYSGGSVGTNGTVFRLQRSGASYLVLQQFQGGASDGRNPFGPLLEGSDGALYGTCYQGGVNGTNGAIYRLNKSGSGYQVLHNFGTIAGNGRRPTGRLAEGTNGAIYGSTMGGGSFEQGTLFRLEKDGSRYLMFRSFHWQSGTVYRDGAHPIGGLIRGVGGMLYGAAMEGGELGLGSVFRITPQPPSPVAYSYLPMPASAGTTVCLGGNAGSAATPYFYQWQKDGTNLVGDSRVGAVTNDTLCITNVQAVDLGSYRLQAANAHGLALSPPVLLRLWPLVAWGQRTDNVTTIAPALTNVAGIAAGYEYSLVIPQRGSVVAFGREQFGRTLVPNGVTNAIAVSAAYYHSLALTVDGRVVGWGGVQGTVPPFLANGLVPAAAIAAAYFHSVALGRDGTVFAWGQDYYGSTMVPPLSNVVAIAAGLNFGLALTREGRVVHWGYAAGGALNVPADLSNVVAIAAGENHGLALRHDGTVRAWGVNNSGQCSVPSALVDVVAVAAGAQHSLALWADGSVAAWGDDTQGQSTIPAGLFPAAGLAGGQGHTLVWQGTGGPAVTVQPWEGFRLRPGESVQLVVRAAGPGALSYQWQANGTNLSGATQSSLALTDVQRAGEGEYRCLIRNAFGVVTSQVSRVHVPLPPQIEFQPAGQRVTAASEISLEVVAQSGALSGPVGYQWRQNGTNLLDDTRRHGARASTLTIANVQGADLGLYSVVVSNQYGAAVSSDAHLDVWPLVAWGADDLGQVSMPSGLDGAVAIATGGAHSLMVDPGGVVHGWGRNDFGQATSPPSSVGTIALAAGEAHSVALRPNGTVVVWGDGRLGQTNPPPGLVNIVGIAAGDNHVLALRRAGTVAAWGDNSHGQSAVPATLATVAAIAAGGRHSLALLSNGTVTAWGGGPEAIVPAQLDQVVAIAAGTGSSLALRSDGRIVAWGSSAATNVPAELTGADQLAAGAEFGLALTSDGRLTAWGSLPASAVPATLSNVVLVAAGSRHVLTMRAPAAEGAARLLNPARTISSFSAVIVTRGGWSYVVEFKRDLAEPAWTPLTTVRGYGYGVLRPFTDIVGADAQRFYRARAVR